MSTPRFISSFVKRLRADTHQDPVRDWLALITLSAVVLAGIIVWNVWAFDTVAQGGTIGTAPTAVSQVFNRTSLDAIQTIFAERSAEEAKYATGAYRYADPSQ
ncbi:hypothetical protein A2950_00960 [Candidatus Kaiserbacteria bacterium RIFCSPLOWO2_01_FULL_55_19]|uniref:Uncharacterized protein n=1 Tax=Candidatus Kaiserbacteria bacterium RIFCSPLOWO2_01_FULL_55_19 TaxID=1798516 RepID=A0A1F6ERZ9_9BACT|nr:MAG: hypothetical protein A2950_00960 [Candidatus Kaiserbacteria bacterium RIFCSPLOWO2_01_FULL_55_19]